MIDFFLLLSSLNFKFSFVYYRHASRRSPSRAALFAQRERRNSSTLFNYDFTIFLVIEIVYRARVLTIRRFDTRIYEKIYIYIYLNVVRIDTCDETRGTR